MRLFVLLHLFHSTYCLPRGISELKVYELVIETSFASSWVRQEELKHLNLVSVPVQVLDLLTSSGLHGTLRSMDKLFVETIESRSVKLNHEAGNGREPICFASDMFECNGLNMMHRRYKSRLGSVTDRC